jgi:hypothetical protein
MPDQDRAQTAYELAELPEESTLRSVTAVRADIAGRGALRVELTDEVTPLNGLKTNPPSPRDKRAIQYFAYPDWKFDRLREDYLDGRYEAAANIGPDEWITFKIDIDDTHLNTTVNDTERLSVTETQATPVAGDIGLFVDTGSESFFSNLKITRR